MFPESEYYDEHFKNIRFTEQTLDSVSFYDCTFENCHFSETSFEYCKFSSCRFIGCDLNLMKMPNSQFSQAGFTGCKLVGINWTEADWPRISVPGLLTFEACTLNHSTFIGLELPQCVMKQCTAKDVDFREANLAKSDLRSTDFSQSVFGETNLTGANLSLAVNYQIDPSQNRIKQATFTLPEAISLLYCMDIHLKEDN